MLHVSPIHRPTPTPPKRLVVVCVVTWIHPVGADACANSIFVPDGEPCDDGIEGTIGHPDIYGQSLKSDENVLNCASVAPDAKTTVVVSESASQYLHMVSVSLATSGKITRPHIIGSELP